MFISIGCYIAISLFLIIFMFPETMSHAYLELVASILANSKTAIDIQQEVLEAAPKDIQPGSSLSGRVAALRAGLVAQYTQCLSVCLQSENKALTLRFSDSEDEILGHRIHLGQMEWRRRKIAGEATSRTCFQNLLSKNVLTISLSLANLCNSRDASFRADFRTSK